MHSRLSAQSTVEISQFLKECQRRAIHSRPAHLLRTRRRRPFCIPRNPSCIPGIRRRVEGGGLSTIKSWTHALDLRLPPRSHVIGTSANYANCIRVSKRPPVVVQSGREVTCKRLWVLRVIACIHKSCIPPPSLSYVRDGCNLLRHKLGQ